MGLLRRGWPPWAALVGQAALFALAHGLAVRLPYTFGLGLLFGLLTLRTGSLWPAIVAHAAHNLLAATLGERLPGPEQPWPWLLAALGLVAVGLAGRTRPDAGPAPRG
ncbi:CPBP family glutamic-type intramembrane protease [Myxococcota bacterium]|nr:CPBP family glutamic-type intramembrane protease [Myxococcota bacterium]